MIRILTGDCRDVLKTLDSASVHMICTSPPYYSLRDYGTATWEGGDPTCDHLQGRLVSPKSGLRNDGRAHTGPYDGEKTVSTGMPFRDICAKCGAHRVDQQIGLEATPNAYVAELVAVFREARRVLRDDGTLWLNIGDSYSTGSSGDRRLGNPNDPKAGGAANWRAKARPPIAGMKPKDLIGIPWMLAFALRADGWYLRQDIIWAKPNAMPESVTDRCTKAHEYVFLLTKSARYFYDAEAIAEPAEMRPQRRFAHQARTTGRHALDAWKEPRLLRDTPQPDGDGTRNRRSVWTIATQPFNGQHFATMALALAALCIKAGCPPGGTVLDPFLGAGTTALVADRLGRHAIGIDLNPTNSTISASRISHDAGLFAQILEDLP